MSQFIEARLYALAQQKGWRASETRMIREVLADQAEGEFLWITLALEELSKVISPLTVERVQMIPKGLANLYHQLLANFDKNMNDIEQRTLEMVYASNKPLTLPELGMALALCQASDFPSELPPGHIIDNLGESYKFYWPILQHDSETNTVQFVHSSAQDYLRGAFFRGGNGTSIHVFNNETAQCNLFKTCFTLLSAKELNQFTEKMSSESEGQTHWWADLDPLPPLLSYAAQTWHVHAHAVDDSFDTDKQMLQLHSNRPQLFYSWMRLASTLGKLALLTRMLSFPTVSVDAVDFKGRRALYLATINNELASASLLLERGAAVDILDNDGRTALSWAAEKGYKAVVRLLLEEGAEINIKDNNGRTPLSLAAEKCHEAVVRLLLEEGAEINIKDNDGWTPLLLSAEKGHEAAVRLLLEKGAEVNIKDNDGQTPLSLAAEKGHEAVVHLLLEKGAEPESTNNYGQMPLLLAVENGHEAVVQLLLDKGAELESTSKNGQTLLSLAAEKGHKAVVQLLLNKSADLESEDDFGQTPLLYAAGNRQEAVVQLLEAAKQL